MTTLLSSYFSRNKKAAGTFILLIFFIFASIGVYILHTQAVSQEVIVTGVFGKVEPPGIKMSLEVSYQIPPTNSLVFKQGDTFYVDLYVWGSGAVNNFLVNTTGFIISFTTPGLPLRINNFTNATVITMAISVVRCCYNGTLALTLSGAD